MRDPFFHSSDIFGIVFVNRAGKYDTIDIIGNIPGTLSIKYIDPLSFQSFGEGAFGTVGTGHTEAGILQNLCETAHADTADTYKINGRGVIKVYLIHVDTSLI